MLRFFFDFDGRITRTQYALGAIGIWGSLFALMVAIALAGSSLLVGQDIASLRVSEMPPSLFEALGINSVAILFVVILAMFFTGLSMLALSSKRFHDMGQSGIWVLLGAVPFVGAMGLFVFLVLLPGQAADNAYGPDPRSGRSQNLGNMGNATHA